jgi:hypothetical protein
MTDPDSDSGRELEPSGRFFHGRSLAPLLKPWIAGLIVAGLVYYFETAMPAFHDVVKIVYFAIGVFLVIVTGRWVRSRERGRRVAERRHGDRRSHGHDS